MQNWKIVRNQTRQPISTKFEKYCAMMKSIISSSFFFIAERAARCISFKNMLLEKNVELFVLTREIWTVAYLKNKRKDNEKEPREMKLWNLSGSRKIYIAVFNELLNFYKYGIENWRRQNNSELVLPFADINTIFSL